MSETDGLATEVAYRALLAVDIERSAGRGNVAFFAAREALATALRGAFLAAGVDWAACLHDDLGDGFRVTAPADTPKRRLLHPLVPELAARLRAHNATAAPAAQVRVRVALHAGDVRLDPRGTAVGRPLEVLARMLDAAPARSALALAPAPVVAAVLVSEHFHDETVRHGYPGIEAERFQQVRFVTKEHAGTAWLQLVGHPDPPPWPGTGVPGPDGPGAPNRPAAEPRAAQPPEGDPLGNDPTGEAEHAKGTEGTGRGTRKGPAGRPGPGGPQGGVSHMVNTARGHGMVFATQNGDQYLHQHHRDA